MNKSRDSRTVISARTYDPDSYSDQPIREVTVKIPWDSDITEWLDSIYTIMIGISFTPKSVLEGMRDFAEDNLSLYPSQEE